MVFIDINTSIYYSVINVLPHADIKREEEKIPVPGGPYRMTPLGGFIPISS